MAMVKNKSVGSRVFDVFNYILLGLIGFVMVFPILFVIVGSFSATGMIGGFNSFSTDAYSYIFTTNVLARSTVNSVFITVVGTLINIAITSITAYALSKKYLPGRKFFMGCVIFFMLFNPGMIPNYLVVNNLGMLNSYWSLWLPIAISAYNMVIMKNFFQISKSMSSGFVVRIRALANISCKSFCRFLFPCLLPKNIRSFMVNFSTLPGLTKREPM